MKRLLLALFAWLAFCLYGIAHAQVGGGFPPAIKPIFCLGTCSGAAIKVGQSIIVTSNTNPAETRTSTVSLTKSTVWDITNLPAGNYRVTFQAQWFNSGGAQGFRGMLNFGACGGGQPGGGNYFMGSTVFSAQNLSGATGAALTAQSDNFGFLGYAFAAGSFELDLCWAQSVSGATATQINGNGGWLQLDRLQ